MRFRGQPFRAAFLESVLLIKWGFVKDWQAKPRF